MSTQIGRIVDGRPILTDVREEDEMIGPKKKKMLDKNICSGCDVVISKEIGATRLYPEKRTVNYCNHKNLLTQVSFIKNFPFTPKWCPVLTNVR